MEELKAEADRRAAEEEAAREKAERDAIAKDDYGLDNWIAGLQTSGIEGIGEMSQEALTALAQRIQGLGLGPGWASGMGFEYLDDLYRSLKIEERYQEKGGGLSDAVDELVEAAEALSQVAEPTDRQKFYAEGYWEQLKTYGDEDGRYWQQLSTFFDGQEDLLDRLEETIRQLTEMDNWQDQKDLPANWWLEASSWRNAGSNENGLTSSDLQGFRTLPAAMSSAVAAGAAKGVSGITVQLDGYTVGRLVAPYVSEAVARDVIIG